MNGQNKTTEPTSNIKQNNDYDSKRSDLKAWKLDGDVKKNLIENYENEE